MTTDETVRDVCAEMDERDYECGNGWLEHYSTRVISAHEREIAAKDAAHKQFRQNYRAKLAEKNAEIARLKEALKPVMEFDECQHDKMLNALRAVREAQRVMRESAND